MIAETGGAGTPHGFSVLWGLCIANYVGANSYAALEQAREFLSIAQSQQETGPLVIGHRLLGTSLMINGDYPAALSHLERAVSLCTPEEHQTLAFQFGQDNRVSALCYWSMALWHRGYPDRGRGRGTSVCGEMQPRLYAKLCAVFQRHDCHLRATYGKGGKGYRSVACGIRPAWIRVGWE